MISNLSSRAFNPASRIQQSSKSLQTGRAQQLNRFLCLLIVLLVAFGAPASLQAQQTTGDILGTVTDSSGAVIPNATITITNIGTHETRVLKSTSSGDYVASLLKAGSYTVLVEMTGFEKLSVSPVVLGAGDRQRVNAPMSVGDTGQTVEVSAQPSSLQTDSSTLSTTIGTKQTQDLPLNGRNFVQLVQLIPGANEGPSASLTNGSEPDDRRQSASISVNGQSEVLNNEMIDGADNNERLIGTTAVRPSIDSIAEINVQTNAYTAEVGRTGGGIINVITKSGTNQFHGDVFEYFRNNIFDANTFNFGNSTLPKTELRLNQFGGGLGGPILKGKTFFYGSYEGYRQVRATAPRAYTVPTLYEEQHPGDFSDTGGGVIAAGQIDKIGLDYFKMLPAPTAIVNGTPEFIHGSKQTQNSTVFDARLDHTINANNSLYGRFIYNSVASGDPGALPMATVNGVTVNPNSAFFAKFGAQDTDFDALLNYTHIFTSNLLLELKASYTRSNNQDFLANEGVNPNAAFGQPNMNTPISDATGLAPIAVVFGTYIGDDVFLPVKDQDNTFQYLGNVTYTRGAHNFKMGATVIRRQLTSVQSSTPQGEWIFLNYPTLLTGQFLIGSDRALSLDNPHLRTWEPAGYIQDDWHASKSLTLNMGLRYGIFTQYKEIQDRISTWDPSTASLLIAGQNASDTAGIKTDHMGLAPRLGFAFSPGHGTVLRGGFGIGYFPMNTTSNANLKNLPFVASTQLCNSPGFGSNPCAAGFQTFAQGLPAIAPTQITSPGASIPDAVSPNFRTSYIEQFNLTAQQEVAGFVGTISYVGLLGRQLAQLIPDLNTPPPNTCATSAVANCYQSLRPYYSKYPNLGTIGYFQTGGSSSYNALQASIERRLKGGFALTANYTWSHSLDNSTGLSEEGANGYGIVPSQTSVRDYGNSDLDLHHRIAGTVIYQLPFGQHATGFRGLAIKGWQANVIGAWNTGAPFTVLNSSNVSGTSSGSDDRPNQISKANLPHPTPSQYFNVDAFQIQAVGALGTERRNQLFGPHYRHLDLSLFKDFPIKQGVTGEFRAESFNLTNTSNFGTPNATIGAGNFGSITSLNYNYTPREIQLALKVQF